MVQPPFPRPWKSFETRLFRSTGRVIKSRVVLFDFGLRLAPHAGAKTEWRPATALSLRRGMVSCDDRRSGWGTRPGESGGLHGAGGGARWGPRVPRTHCRVACRRDRRATRARCRCARAGRVAADHSLRLAADDGETPDQRRHDRSVPRGPRDTGFARERCSLYRRSASRDGRRRRASAGRC